MIEFKNGDNVTIRQTSLILVASATIFGIAVLKSDYVQTALQAKANASVALLYDLQLDPKIGQHLELPQRDYSGRHLPASPLRTLVVAAGGCSSCSIKKLDFRALNRLRNIAVIVVFDSPATEFKALAKKLSPEIFVIEDRNSKLSRTLNSAFFSPRCVLLGNQLKIIKLQPYNQLFSAFIEEINAK